jgi:hypothetical protein
MSVLLRHWLIANEHTPYIVYTSHISKDKNVGLIVLEMQRDFIYQKIHCLWL